MSKRQLRKEEEAAIRRLQRQFRIMARTRRTCRSGRGLLAAVFDTEGLGDWQGAPAHVRDAAFACRLCRTPESCDAFRRLVLHVETHAGRLIHAPCTDGQRSYLMPLQRLAERHADWRGAPEDWRPASKNAPRQFISLARHLLGPRSLGPFLAETWFVPAAVRARTWFQPLRLGQGKGGLAAPTLPLTRRMALQHLNSPSCLDPIRAFRRAQVAGLGGDPSLGDAVGYSSLAWQLWEPPDEEWWLDLLGWMAAQAEASPEWVSRIVEYAIARRCGNPDEGRQPDLTFSCRGRTFAALKRLIEESETRYTHTTVEQEEFGRSGIRPGRYRFRRGDYEEVWTIDEILSSGDLAAEGRTMRHCAGIYTRTVRRGIYSIWSMSRGRGSVLHRTATVRVANHSRRIVEYRGKANRPLHDDERRILRLWAADNNLWLP